MEISKWCLLIIKAVDLRSNFRRYDISLCFIIEDDFHQNRLIVATLKNEGFHVKTFYKGGEAMQALKTVRPEVIILDLGLPDIDGMSLIPAIHKISPRIRIIVLTGNDSVRHAVKALQLGARHYLVKPWDHKELLLILDREYRSYYQKEINEHQQHAVITKSSPLMQQISDSIQKLAESPETPVLIEGETGVGKEVLARKIHAQTGCIGDFIALNCASLPGELLESDLFGHERGAFTGATSNKRGMVDLAKHGTLLLDEITEMPINLQPKLLRFLQEHTYRSIGSNIERHCPCRVIATTNRCVEDALNDIVLRPDLFYRLAVIHLVLPPLRERSEDIIPLAKKILSNLQKSIPGPPRIFSESSSLSMLNHSWPGNIRELRNRIERALVLGSSDTIYPIDLDLGERLQLSEEPEKMTPEYNSELNICKNQILHELNDNEGNISRTARKLGLPRHRLRYRLKKMKLTK